MASAKKRREQAERVATVEREIKVTQREGQSSSRKGSQAKKTFSRNASFENEVSHVLGHTPAG